MSDIAENQNSFITNLTNKLTYKLQEAVYDPKANEYAEKKQEQKQEQIQEKEEKTTVIEEDPNKFSGKRFLKKTINQFFSFVLKSLPFFIALMIAMIVANEMIVYAVPVRIIFFIFTFLITLLYPLALIALPFFYLVKGGFSYYINNMTDGPKRRIMPEIYALLPITTYKPQSTFMRILMYPFYYPKDEMAANELPKIMDDYWDSLQESFKDIEKVKALPLFAEDLKKAKAFLDRMHLEKKPETSSGIQGGQPTSNVPSKNSSVPTAPVPSAPINQETKSNIPSKNSSVPPAPAPSAPSNQDPIVPSTLPNVNENPTKIVSKINNAKSITNEVGEVSNEVKAVADRVEKEAQKIEGKVKNEVKGVSGRVEKEAQKIEEGLDRPAGPVRYDKEYSEEWKKIYERNRDDAPPNSPWWDRQYWESHEFEPGFDPRYYYSRYLRWKALQNKK